MTRFLLAATLAAAAAATASAAPPKCNPEALNALAARESPSQMVFGGGKNKRTNNVAGTGPLTFLPHDLSNPESAACLDGSPYGFYFVPSQTNSTKWTISINGGGWCVGCCCCCCMFARGAVHSYWPTGVFALCCDLTHLQHRRLTHNGSWKEPRDSRLARGGWGVRACVRA